jgi:CBS domain-containing protein
MSYPLTTVKLEATVLDAIDIMVNEIKGCVLVAKEDLLKDYIGIVTTTQIFRQVFAVKRDPSHVRVNEIMTPAPLITIGFNASAKEAAELMTQHKIRRLPVVEKGALVGIITSTDLLKCMK